jgi:hypothetical protein
MRRPKKALGCPVTEKEIVRQVVGIGSEYFSVLFPPKLINILD